jgi:hypothetical protein
LGGVLETRARQGLSARDARGVWAVAECWLGMAVEKGCVSLPADKLGWMIVS